jgi:hypothetical protein
MNSRQKLILIIYTVILIHFLFSNFVFAIGPSYAIQPPSFNTQCTPTAYESCISSCSTGYNPYPTFYQSKGFPFTTNKYQGVSCAGIIGQSNSYPINDFTALRYNILYIAGLTVISTLVFFWPKRSIRK